MNCQVSSALLRALLVDTGRSSYKMTPPCLLANWKYTNARKSVLSFPKAYFCLLKIRNIFFVEIEIGLFLGSVCMLVERSQILYRQLSGEIASGVST